MVVDLTMSALRRMVLEGTSMKDANFGEGYITEYGCTTSPFTSTIANIPHKTISMPLLGQKEFETSMEKQAYIEREDFDVLDLLSGPTIS